MAAEALEAAEFRLLERLLGGRIQSVERAPWGFTNKTDVLTLVGGERVVLQRYVDQSAAQHRMRLTSGLRGPLLARGVPIPRLIRADLHGDLPYALYEALPGIPGPTFLDEGRSNHTWQILTTEMGRMLQVVSAVPITDIPPLPSLWADPNLLAKRAAGWLDDSQPDLSATAAGEVRRLIAAVPGLFKGRGSVLAHGDFAPANVLVSDDRISALLDWEFARRADPLFDVAWWGWLVRYHHPGEYAAAWPILLEAAAFHKQDERFEDQVFTLQALRLLELATTSGESSARLMWTLRLSETMLTAPRDGSRPRDHESLPMRWTSRSAKAIE